MQFLRDEGAQGLLRSRSMCFSIFSCIDNSAMRFSCSFIFCSRAALEEDEAGRGCETGAGTGCDTAHGGAVAQPPLKRIPPIRTTIELLGHRHICISFWLSLTSAPLALTVCERR
ncbi:MAG: hypothetical protein K0S58_1042 [Nitrospira sp.]|jgi:hypothetical protein|nr:hypothetical protein [Nitrospira sp.]